MPLTVALDGMDDHVARSFRAALARLSAAGALVQELELPAFARLATINAKGGLTAAEAWWWHRGLIEKAAAKYDPRVVSRILRGKEISAADYLDVQQARAAWTAEIERAIEGFDALVLPTVPVVAPTVAELAASDDAYFSANGLILRNPTLVNFLDGAALSLPCQEPGTGPVGLMVAGPAMSDRRILSLGLAMESVLQPR